MAAKLYGAGHHADERPAGNPAVVAEIDAAKAAKRIVAEAKAQEKAKTAGRRPDPDAKALGGMWADQVERIGQQGPFRRWRVRPGCMVNRQARCSG